MTGTSFHDQMPSASTRELLSSPWLWLILCCGVGASGALTVFFSWNVFDEGFTAKGGDIVLRGQLLFRDFLTLYGPAQFYLLAGLYWMFGVQLLVLRIWSTLLLGAFALLLYLVAVRLGGNSRAVGLAALIAIFLILLFHIPSPGYSMVPAGALLMGAALPLNRFAYNGHGPALGLASLLIGLAALFRWEQGVFGLTALGAALIFWLARSKQWSLKEITRLASWALTPALGLIVIVYVPLFLAAGVHNFVEDVLIHSFRDFGPYRGIDFVRPQIWDVLRAYENGQATQAIIRSIPLLGISLASLAILATLIRALAVSRSPTMGTMTPNDATQLTAVYVALVVLGLMNQMRIRPDESRSVLIIATAIPLFAFWLRLGLPLVATRMRLAFWGTMAIAMAFLGIGAVDAIQDQVRRRPLVRTESPHSRLIYNPVHSKGYNALIAYVLDQTKPGELIYSGVTNHQVLLLNDAMLYFLTGRDGPTRFYEMDPGLANTRQAQQSIASAIEKAAVRLLVLWDVQSTETNLSSRPNGIDLLDNYIRKNYTLETSFDDYQVWRRKGEAAGATP